MRGVAWLGVLRHGESVGNVAAQAAESGGLEDIDIDMPDAVVPLSPLGREQADGVGRWLAGLAPGERPDKKDDTTNHQAAETGEIALAQLPDAPKPHVDERSRDRELGILDRLTSRGVASRLPDEHARRRYLGPFYYRPPGGESWADVALRLRSFLRDIDERFAGKRVLLVAHEAIILIFRYVIEELTVDDLLAMRHGRLANAALTSWSRTGDGDLLLETFDDTTIADHPTTRQHDV